ncbi:MAG: pantetheine-phosphate adenylyltransferase [Clostridia bacterium]|nr:pantetheine-phosphate adenylyltransferase [Clostridia bacterium]
MNNTGKKCVFAGTFDPPTLGHKALIEDCLRLFDEVVVAVLVNPTKQPCFTIEQRKEMLALTVGKNERVKIREFSGTATELLREEQTDIYVRGIRNGVDLDYENANLYASHKLDKDMLTVYLPCRQELLHVSSSIVRNSLQFQTPIDEYVTKEVQDYIRNIYCK